MKIGLELSVLQTPHRMRGIGSTAINFVNNLPDSLKSQHSFIFYLYTEDQKSVLSLLDLKNLNYEIRNINRIKKVSLSLPSKLKRIDSLLSILRDNLNQMNGDPRINTKTLDDLDVYLQFDQMQVPPKVKGLQTYVILYDLIPYILEPDYLWSYKTSRKNGDSRKSSFRKSLLRKQYIKQVRLVCESACNLIAISEHTKEDFIKYIKIPESKIKVIHLGISEFHKNYKLEPKIEHYLENSWGYFTNQIDLLDKPYILFVGGADPRRKLIDLVAAFNRIRALGIDMRLVFAGDTMKGTKTIPLHDVQKYLQQSSYVEDISFMGFVTDEQREWLYKNSLAVVYPSVYEGFGLPILEAMQHGTPVITYKNSSIHEIALDAVIYANDCRSIAESILSLLKDKSLRQKYQRLGIKQSSKYSWDETINKIFKTF